MVFVNYFQIYSFHPVLNLYKNAIFQSFQQTAEEIYDLSHFNKEHVVFKKEHDAVSAVLAREKSTSLAELFSVEFKFTIDTSNDWF